MVSRAPSPSLRLASCCRVEVMNGAAGLRLVGLASTELTLNSRELTACRAASAASASAMS